MPKGPLGEKRPVDVIGTTFMLARIATGQIEDAPDQAKNPAAVALGKLGGKRGGKAPCS